MTIEIQQQPESYGFNSKAADVELVAFFWVDNMAHFSVGGPPVVRCVKLRCIGNKTKTKFRVDLVQSDEDDQEFPFMSDEDLSRVGLELSLHLAAATGLKCDPVKPGLFAHG